MNAADSGCAEAQRAPLRPLSSPSGSQEGGNEPSCRASSAELDMVGPIPPGEACGPSDAHSAGPKTEAHTNAHGRLAPGRGRAQRAAAGGAALPCQNRNNSTGRYRFQDRPDAENCVQSSDGRTWAKWRDEVFVSMDAPSTAEAKAAFQLRGNVDSFVAAWGHAHCAFWTITDLEGITPREFSRRWNSLLAHHGEWIRAFIRVLEPQMNGNPHYHLLVAVPWDMRPAEFDWTSFAAAARQHGESKAAFRLRQRSAEWRAARQRYVASSAPETVAVWRRLRKHLAAYGLGRSEFVPVRKLGAITEYIGKYLEAGVRIRIHGWKGARRVETDRRTSAQWKTHSRQFSWFSPGAREWRQRVGEVASFVGVADLGGIADKLGTRWAYWLRGYMTASKEEWDAIAPAIIPIMEARK